jgi:hypothetical protein
MAVLHLRHIPALKRRSLAIAAGAAVIGLGVAWTIAWHQIASGMRDRLETWAEARRAEGLTVSHKGLAIEGFPFAWQVRVSEPVIAGAGSAAWAWQGEALEARFTPADYRDVALRFPGDHRLAAGGGALSGTWRVRAARPEGRILLYPDGRLNRLEFDFGDATLIRLPDEKAFQAVRLQGAATVPRPAASDPRAETFTVTIDIDSLSPVEPPVANFGPLVRTVRLDLAAKGRLPGGRFSEALRAWRDDGGTVEINHVKVRWGPVDAEVSGTLTLDAQDRPLGAFSARWRGYNETIDALQVAGHIGPWPAAGTKMALTALARQQADGGRQIELPITLQDGRVYIAGIPVMRLQPLRLD